jgi:hypothetical protein
MVVAGPKAMSNQGAPIRLGFWACVMLAGISAVLPFIPERWLVGVTAYLAILGAPVLWIVAFWGASHFDCGRRWWLWFAAPFALRSVAEGVAAILFWLVRGFAP